VIVFDVILVAFGIATYAIVSRQALIRLDTSLEDSLDLLVQAVVESGPSVGLSTIRIPNQSFFVFDSEGRPLAPPDPPGWVIAAVAASKDRSVSYLTFEVSTEGDVGASGVEDADQRVHVRAFGPGSAPLLGVAATSVTGLDDQYAGLILALSVSALAAILVAGAGGGLLAYRASMPVRNAYEQVQRFAADAAHELRTPLSTIRLRAESALAGEPDGDRQIAVLRDIADEGRRLGDTIDRLLFLARTTGEGAKIQAETVHLDDVIFDVLPAAQAMADEKGIRIRVVAVGSCSVVGDSLLLRQLLGALIENATKFSPPGSEIEVGARGSHDRVELSVRDQGPGIPAELQTHVFEPFYRADPADIGPGGVGIGLAIVRGIAEAHGARVSIRAPEGHGAVFSVSFPRVRA